MVFFHVTPNHIRLIDACYPAAPLAAGPQFRPNSQELSRLTYYASNRPGKLNKLSDELEKRAKNHARRAQAGNAKSRAILLVTLDIFRALTAECRRELNLFSSGVINSVDAALTCLPADLEVVARAASSFTAWATYTDGTLLGVDTILTQTYLNVLKTFSTMGIMDPQKADDEFRSRKRLVGLAAISSAIQSDALFNSMSIFSKEVDIIVTALLRVIASADISMLTTEATAVEIYSNSSNPVPYMAEFQPQRPLAQRRAPSIHVHVDGEKGPSFSDVVGASLRALQTLVAHSNAVQVPVVLEAIFETFDNIPGCGWENIELCRWIVAKVTDWTQYQYRYAIPARLLERLTAAKDVPEPAPIHLALVTMITTVFTSPTPLINVSTSDILSNLVNIMIARLAINPEDPLLAPLVGCVSSLGTHIYYADQLQDLAEELVSRLVGIQVNGLLGRGRAGNDKGREEGMRCLVACLAGLLEVADQTHPSPTRLTTVRRPSEQIRRAEGSRFSGDGADPPSPSRDNSNGDIRSGTPEVQRQRRNKVAPEVWQDTLALLCEAEFAVRSDYACALVRFIRGEITKEPFAITDEKDKSRSKRLLIEKCDTIAPSDATMRFLHALHATIFTLALAPSLGLISNAPSASSSSSLGPLTQSPINIIPPTPVETPRQERPPPNESDAGHGGSSDHLPETKTANPMRRSTPSAIRPRQASLGLSLLELASPNGSASLAGSPATLSDYAYLLRILTAIHETLPSRALLTGVPMLLALDCAVGGASENEDEGSLQKRKAIREVIGRMWLTIATVWDCPTISEVAGKVSSYFAESSSLPAVPTESDAILPRAPRQPVTVSSIRYTPVDPFVLTTTYIIDPEVVTTALSSNSIVQKATGLDAAALKAKLSAPWSADKAVKESIDAGPCYDTISRSEGTTHFLKISPALMNIDNQSLASLARTARGVGVEELREALEGRGSMSNTNLAPTVHSMSTDADHKSHRTRREVDLSKVALTAASKQRKTAKSSPADVADVLNRLGIGKQNSSKMLHAPLQTAAKKKQDTSDSKVLVPPYTA